MLHASTCAGLTPTMAECQVMVTGTKCGEHAGTMNPPSVCVRLQNGKDMPCTGLAMLMCESKQPSDLRNIHCT
eukprot:jgi/Mesvir1/16522/Mv10072-RA.1